LLKINYGESVINDTALRSILTGIPNYDLPAMVDPNGDAVTEVESTEVFETPKRKDPSSWEVLSIKLTDTDNQFIVQIQDGINDKGEPQLFGMKLEDPFGFAQISIPYKIDGKRVYSTATAEYAQEIMAALKGQITESAIDKLMKDKAKLLPGLVEGGASVLGEAETETITQIDEEGTSAEKTFQGLMGRDQFNRTLARIRKKVSEGYKDVPAGLGGGVTSFFRDDPQARERRETSIRAFKWFRNKATTYFKQQPNQILEAEKDPVAWYIRYEKQFLTESK
jgi:hypothetical protein